VLGIARDSNVGWRAILGTKADSEVAIAPIDYSGFEEWENGSELFGHGIIFSAYSRARARVISPFFVLSHASIISMWGMLPLSACGFISLR